MSSARIIHNGGALTADFVPGTDILSLLRENGIKMRAPCGGNGTCGKCRVLISENGTDSREALACRTIASDGMTITVPEDSFGIIETVSGAQEFKTDGEEGFGLAFDIGTTSVAAALVSLSDGALIDTCSGWNSQRHRGRDVISRAQFTLERDDGLDILSKDINSQIEEMSLLLLKRNGIEPGAVKRVAIAGNTVMEHLVCGLDVENIVRAPFVPRTLFRDETGLSLSLFPDAEALITPCISGYVGGDIVSGLCSEESLRSADGSFLYLDIGTNGEVVIYDKRKLTCCSVAMGPAFEGARISCGMRSVTGAIDHFSCDTDLKRTVIGDGEPAGICGTGLIELVSILLDRGLIDGSGRLLDADELDISDPLVRRLDTDADGANLFWVDRDNGIYLSSADIRQVQLAKRAMATGIELLTQRSGLVISDIDRIYIAGGFGRRLDIDACMNIGLLPGGIRNRTVYLGNASLRGSCRALCSKAVRNRIRQTARGAEHIELSLSGLFSDRYIDNLNFREEN